jgi:hypothetical protein
VVVNRDFPLCHRWPPGKNRPLVNGGSPPGQAEYAMAIEDSVANRRTGRVALRPALYRGVPPLGARGTVVSRRACYLQSPLLWLTTLHLRLQP